MADKLLNFESFHKFQSILEELTNEVNSELILEKFDSSILRELTAQESGSRWQKGLASDIAKKFNFAVDKITNEDFTILTNSSDWWTQGWAKNDDNIGFFVDDDPELRKALKAKELKNQFPSRTLEKMGSVGLVMCILRGKTAMWTGLATHNGGTSWRYKRSDTERYGALADQYKMDSAYGYNSGKVAKMTIKNIKQETNKVYVLNLADLREKYSTSTIKADRAAAKAGAVALMDNKDFKKKQIERYNKILQERLDPKAMLDDVKKAMTTYLAAFTKKVDELDFDPKKYDGNFYQNSKVKWGNWDEQAITPIQDMWRLIENFFREYDRYLDAQSQAEEIQKEIDKEKDEQKRIRLESRMDYYAKAWERFVAQAITYRNDLNTVLNRVKAIS